MADPYLSEIRVFSFAFPPKNWALCNGQLLPINQNQALFSLLGTTYGGNGQTTFALPNLQGRVPIHFGAGHSLGEQGGEQAHTLTQAELPTHTHAVRAGSTAGASRLLAGNLLAAAPDLYANPGSLTPEHASSVTSVGGGQAHTNLQPFLTLSYCIALIGIFPSPN